MPPLFAVVLKRIVVQTLRASCGSNDDRALAAAVPDQSAPSGAVGLVLVVIGGGIGGGTDPFHAGGAGERVEGEEGTVDGHKEQVIAAVRGPRGFAGSPVWNSGIFVVRSVQVSTSIFRVKLKFITCFDQNKKRGAEAPLFVSGCVDNPAAYSSQTMLNCPSNSMRSLTDVTPSPLMSVGQGLDPRMTHEPSSSSASGS